MALLERVTRMKSYGMSENQIIDSLKQEGFSPSDINESLAQSKIKESVETENNFSNYGENNFDDNGPMQPSIMVNQNRENFKSEKIKDNTQQESEREDNYYQDSTYNDQPATIPYQQDYDTQEQYPEYNPDYNQQQPGEYSEYQPPQPLDMETIGDIAEQIIEEKNEQLKKQISSFANFKKEISMDMKRLDERMSKIEDIFAQLQISILKKIGEYGEDVKNISNEMHKTQESFSKILNPLTDNIRELKKFVGENEKPEKIKGKEIQNNKTQQNASADNISNKKRTGSSINRNPSFDDYLR